MGSKAKAKEGHCALTGAVGRFVKSHIISQAFTRPTEKGAPLYQSTRGEGELRRWSSWYDSELVTQEGEDILAEIDDEAIKVLRKYQLVWSSWIICRPHFEALGPLLPDHGYRSIIGLEAKALIRFAISVAWRASVSKLQDMRDARLEPELQERLREITFAGNIYGVSPFPVSLIQLSSFGERHNQSPYVDYKRIVHLDGREDEVLKIMRIYLDGLIFHVHLSEVSPGDLEGNSIFLGASDRVTVTSVGYAASFQYENMLNVMRECFPSLVERNS